MGGSRCYLCYIGIDTYQQKAWLHVQVTNAFLGISFQEQQKVMIYIKKKKLTWFPNINLISLKQ